MLVVLRCFSFATCPSNLEQATVGQARAVPEQWPSIHQRGIIAVALSSCAVLLAIGPAAYCWLNQGRAELADTYRGTAHPLSSETDCCHSKEQASPSHHHRPALYLGRDYVNEVASGGINGLLMMVATVVSGIGIDMPGQQILALGAASLVSYAFSMGFGAFVVEEAKEGFANSQLQEEYEEVRSMPQSEVDEMICHYRKRGLSDQDARAVAQILSQYEDFWVHHMMAEELGIQLPRGGAAAMHSGLVMPSHSLRALSFEGSKLHPISSNPIFHHSLQIQLEDCMIGLRPSTP
ncbi:pcl1 [Symbiodinium pilosum]|uniref:Pcl1 protein n=1 Tax=Symbiodinium pilosum TaxID=2952 RepID=A0A812WUV2_SYMPI|nr:pcl1 [Symbiodinium pilosum]